MIDPPNKLIKQLEALGQTHVLAFWDELSADEKVNLVNQLSFIDFDFFEDQVAQLNAKQEKHYSDIAPCNTEVRCNNSDYQQAGDKLIANGELGVLTVAGGDGTRLGWGGPKGTFPATPLTGKSLFQIFAEQIVFAERKYKTTIPWYIMTSASNANLTKSFLLDNNCFGLDRTNIFVFNQAENPVLDSKGKMLLATKSKIAVSPNGHGGVISALKSSGGLAEMAGRGINYLSYSQIDNPLARIIDPIFLGMHVTSDQSSSEVSSKAICKTNPEEKVGVFCSIDNQIYVVEYSNLTDSQATEKNSDGTLKFSLGSIALHMFTCSFLEEIALELPSHIVNKVVPHVDANGVLINSSAPNGYKFEKFVFDVLPMAKKPLIVSVDRAEEFAPIKNASGVDSPESSHALQIKRSAAWLIELGISVPPDARVELSPLLGASPQDLASADLPSKIAAGEELAI